MINFIAVSRLLEPVNFDNLYQKFQDGGYHVNGPLYANGTEKDPNDDLKNIIPLGFWVHSKQV